MRSYGNFLDTQELFAKEVTKLKKVKGVDISRKIIKGVEVVRAIINNDNDLMRSEGEYLTINIKNFYDNYYINVIKILSKHVKQELKGAKKLLVVGMGNEFVISDALGPKVVEKLDVIKFATLRKSVAKLAPGVGGNSGLESFDVVLAITRQYKPDVVIVVDSLCASNYNRIGKSFQITNAGIVPGSASGETKCKLNKDSLGTKVVAIGVPLVVYLQSVVTNVIKKIKPLNHNDLKVLNELLESSMYSPKDIDVLVEICSKIIAKAIEDAII